VIHIVDAQREVVKEWRDERNHWKHPRCFLPNGDFLLIGKGPWVLGAE
jgi:hypothetical protein